MSKARLVKVDNSLCNLLELIDEKIYKLAASELDNLRFNLGYKTNFDLYEDLVDYRNVVERRMLGCNCLESAPIDIIASRIKKLVNNC